MTELGLCTLQEQDVWTPPVTARSGRFGWLEPRARRTACISCDQLRMRRRVPGRPQHVCEIMHHSLITSRK